MSWLSWIPVGPYWGVPLRPSCEILLGAVLDPLKLSWGCLGFWGGIWKRSWAILGLSWAVLTPSWVFWGSLCTVWELSWDILRGTGVIFGALEAWGGLGFLLGQSWGL